MLLKFVILFYKKPLIFLGLFFLTFTTIIAQSITTTQFLNDANIGNHLKIDSVNTVLKSYNYKESIINSIQLRSETKNFQLNKQEYTLRVKPTSFKTIKNNNKIFLNKIEKIKLENEIDLNKQLKNQYFIIIDFVFTNKLIKLYRTKETQLKDKLNILKQQVYTTNFDVDDLVETEENLQNVALKLMNLQEIKTNLMSFIHQYLKIKAFKNFELDDFIKPEQIIEIQSNSSFSENNIELSLQKLKLNQIENKLQLETSKSKQIISYFQTKYGGKNNFLFKENLSLGIGINLPFFGNYKRKKGMYLFEKLSEEHKLNTLKENSTHNNTIKSNALKTAILNYKKLKKQKDESSVIALLKTYKKIDGISPLTLLKMELLLKKKEIEQVKITHLLYQSYIDFLATNGALFQKPFRNYLAF